MSDLKEVFELATKQTEPDLDSWKEQERRQRRASRNRKIGAIALVAALIAGIAIVAAANMGDAPDPVPGTDQPSPPVGSQATPLGLAIVGLDGSVRQEIGLPTDAWEPDLSSDGQQVVFLTRSNELGFCGGCAENVERVAVIPVGQTEGYYAYVDTENGIHLSLIEDPVFSPDGTQLAFVGVHGVDDQRDIFRVSLDPGRLPVGTAHQLTSDPAIDEFPTWSPDGSTIFYDKGGADPLDDSGFSDTQEIWSVPAGGGTPRQLTHNQVPDSMPDVAPDGTVAYWHGGDIWTMSSDGAAQQRLAAVPHDTGFNPRWSPDGSMIALLRYDGSERASLDPRFGQGGDYPLLQVVVVTLSTGEVTPVGPRVASDVNPVSWTPDGQALLINRYDDGPTT